MTDFRKIMSENHKRFNTMSKRDKFKYITSIVLAFLLTSILIFLSVVLIVSMVRCSTKPKASAESVINNGRMYQTGEWHSYFDNGSDHVNYSYSFLFQLSPRFVNGQIQLSDFYMEYRHFVDGVYTNTPFTLTDSYEALFDVYAPANDGLDSDSICAFYSLSNNYSSQSCPFIFIKGAGMLYKFGSEEWRTMGRSDDEYYVSLYDYPDFVEFGYVNSNQIFDFSLAPIAGFLPRAISNQPVYMVHWLWSRDGSGKYFDDGPNGNDWEGMYTTYEIYLCLPFDDSGTYSSSIVSNLPTSIVYPSDDTGEPYRTGYQLGYDDGYDWAWIDGRNWGTSADYSGAYSAGFSDGMRTKLSDVDPFALVSQGVEDFLDITLFGSFKISYLFYIAIGSTLFLLLLKVFLK